MNPEHFPSEEDMDYLRRLTWILEKSGFEERTAGTGAEGTISGISGISGRVSGNTRRVVAMLLVREKEVVGVVPCGNGRNRGVRKVVVVAESRCMEDSMVPSKGKRYLFCLAWRSVG